jgi:predicted nuclease with TOPRIM domain
MCHDSITNLRNENASLNAKIDKLNESISSLRTKNASLNAKFEELKLCKSSTSNVGHIAICTRCRDVNVEAIHDHLALVKQQNDHIAQLTAKINEH